MNEDDSSIVGLIAAGAGADQTSKPAKQVNVLVIEDNRADFQLLKHHLSVTAGVRFELVHADQLSKGLECLADGRFDVVLLDLNLPDSTGIETFQKLHFHAPQVPTIVLTGFADESLAIQAAKEGAQDYLFKGNLDQDALIRSLRYSIARHRTKAKLARALENAKASEANLRNIITSNVDGMIVLDRQGMVQFANPAAQVLLGHTANELVLEDFGLPVLAGETTELEINQHGGRQVPVEMRTVDVQWEGRPGLLVVLHDLTRQRQAAESLRQTAADLHKQTTTLESILNSIGEGVVVADETGKFLVFNPAAERIVGLGATDTKSAAWSTTYGVYDPDRVTLLPTDQLPLVRALRGEQVDDVEIFVQNPKVPDGISLSASASPVKSADGDLTGGVVVFRDITERKRAEEQRVAINIAREVQQDLFPSESPCLPGFDIAGAAYPADRISGDYFDFIPMAEESLGVVVADACGHGFGPAMLMAQTHAYLHALSETLDDPAEILNCVDRFLPVRKSGRFVTMLFGLIDPQTRSLVYATAGHCGYLLNSLGDVRILDSKGTPLGVEGPSPFSSAPAVTLQPGDLILLPTDGIIETRSPDQTLLGEERMLEIVRTNRERSAQEIVQSLYQATCDYTQGQPQSDDITVVVVKVV